MTNQNAVTDRAILACYAHPDDEQGVTGTFRLALEHGYRVGLLCATRGEVGEIADPSLATPETLGAVREDELRRAVAVIGAVELFFLPYRDSGMVGTPPNADPTNWVNADEGEAVGHIVRVIRTFRPTIVLTFDPSGGYGHPDHLAIQRRTEAAFAASADPSQYPEAGPAFAPARLYYASFGRSMIYKIRDWIVAQGLPAPFPGVDPEKMGLADEEITNEIDVSAYLPLKRASLNEHRTQMNPNSPLARIPEEVWAEWRSTERFAWVAGVPLPPGADRADLFAGL